MAVALGCGALAARTPSTESVAVLALVWLVGIFGAVPRRAGDRGPRGAGCPRSDWWYWPVATAAGAAAFVAIGLLMPPNPVPAAGVVLFANVLAGVAEEAFFRRFAYAWLLGRGTGVAVVTTALLFALVHLPAYGPGVLPLDFAAGLLLGWQRWATGGWTAPALTHVVANLIA